MTKQSIILPVGLAVAGLGGDLFAAQSTPADQHCDPNLIPITAECARIDSNTVVEMPVGENTERSEVLPGDGFDIIGFSISIDGETLSGAAAPRIPNRQRDIALAQSQVQVTFDGLGVTPRLSLRPADSRESYSGGEVIRFVASTNYPAFIKRSEVRIMDERGRMVSTVPIVANGEASWRMPITGSSTYRYQFRVYDAAGRYNQTRPLTLTRSNNATSPRKLIRPSDGEDDTSRAGFRPTGGAVTVSGSDVRGRSALVMGEAVAIDPTGRFVMQRILPVGEHMIAVGLPDGSGLNRAVTIPAQDLYYVGLVDLTFGRTLRDDSATLSGAFKNSYAEGRLAYFAQGRTAGGWEITSSLDTGEGPLRDAFRRLDSKDPLAVLRRLDDSDFYPVYGDDSTAYDATPTQGRFYLKAQHGPNAFVFGDFDVAMGVGTLLKNRRSLYGAQLTYGSASVTSNGDPRVEVQVYSASPDMLPQRDVLQGTGGSAYFLSRQDIHGGSEQVVVEVRDPQSGRTITQAELGQDEYRIDYVQGVVILNAPLSSHTASDDLVRGAPQSEPVAELVVNYEYTPSGVELSGASLGAEVMARPTDRLTFSALNMQETTGVADQKMRGVSLDYRLTEGSFLHAEVAETVGPGFGLRLTANGGLTGVDQATAGQAGVRARAYKLDAQIGLADLSPALSGDAGFYYERREAGFSSLRENIAETQELIGGFAHLLFGTRNEISLAAERFEKAGGDRTETASVSLRHEFSLVWVVSVGIERMGQEKVDQPAETGTRTDAALRVTYSPADDLALYGFAQSTIMRTGGLPDNDRYGVGGRLGFAKNWEIEGEISDGTLGRGASVQLARSSENGDQIYAGLSKRVEAWGDAPTLSWVYGGRRGIDDAIDIFTETTMNDQAGQTSLLRSFGVNYNPNDLWGMSASAEIGEVTDPSGDTFDRAALSVGLAYREDDIRSGKVRLEYRLEDGAGVLNDRDTWQISANYRQQSSDNWRFLADIDTVISEDAAGDTGDGRYVEASLAFAYRPVENDKTNALVRLTYLEDLPAVDQRNADGETNGDRQRRLIFSADINHDIGPHWTVGAKYGLRRGEVAPRGPHDFVTSTAHLGILRADWHVVHNWDLGFEYRATKSKEIGVLETGGLIGVYRHVGNNLKVGVGYEFGSVSDVLRDVSYENEGLFANIVAKF